MVQLNNRDDWNWGDDLMMAIICALVSGMTIVLSRSINSLLATKTGPYQSTFFNYLVGLITSLLFLFLINPQKLSLSRISPIMLTGGIIGVFNVLILTMIVSKISPVKLTLLTFISQLVSAMILDYFFFHIFTIKKIIGCTIILIGLTTYQFVENDT